MSECVRRREVKYEFDGTTSGRFRGLILGRLPRFEFKRDRPFTYVTTVYFDSPTRALYKRARESYDRSLKVRLKEYYYKPDGGPIEVSSDCFVEIKEHVDDVVTKRRLRVPKRLLAPLLRRRSRWEHLVARASGLEFDDSGREVYREIADLLEKFRLEPFAAINYRRAVYQENESRLRITFDDQLRVFQPVLGLYEMTDALTGENLGAVQSALDTNILEVKCPGAFPAWLDGALRFHNPQQFSKFTASMDALSARRCECDSSS